MIFIRRLPAGLLLGLSLALLALGSVVFANGVPVKVVLGYQNGLSNWGPKGAAGVADIRVGEGYVGITAAGLPRLDNGQQYEGWLINTRTQDKFATGRFNAAEDGSVSFSHSFDSIPDKHYDLFLLCVVQQDQQTTEPTAQVSIAGYFPKLQPVSGTARPAELPYTGPEPGPAPVPPATPSPWSGPLPVIGAALAGVVVGFLLRSLTSVRPGGRP